MTASDDYSNDGAVSRREFLSWSAAGVVAGTVASPATASAASVTQDDLPPSGSPEQRVLVRGGVVLTMDRQLGDFEKADVLIEGSKIAAVGPGIASNTAVVVDASRMIVMPGFVDSHRHMWQAQLRHILPNGRIDSDYPRDISGTARTVYRPEDVRLGNLLTAWGAVNAGVTTVLDWSHISNSPEHADAAVQGLNEAGIRAVYAYGPGGRGSRNAHPRDIYRLRKKYFGSDDQLLTLALATGDDPATWAVARDVGAPITLHVNGTGALLAPGTARQMGPDVTYIHCCRLSLEEWKLIADTGGGVSISAPVEMEMGHGVPAIQSTLDHRIQVSLSCDVETGVPSEFFTQMRTIYFLQRMMVFARERAGEKDVPPLLTVKQVVEIATMGGAKVNHLEREIGSLTPGKQADLILLAANTLNVAPLNHAYGAVVLGMDTSNVDTVLIGGKVKKWRGQLVGVQMDRLRREVEASREYLLARAGWPRTVLGGYLPGH
jgi:5-methylthioadenosine/S-adenosylhomocysteine deaminase